MKTVLATPATITFLRTYSRFGDEHKMRVGDTVQIREEHEPWVLPALDSLELAYKSDGAKHIAETIDACVLAGMIGTFTPTWTGFSH